MALTNDTPKSSPETTPEVEQGKELLSTPEFSFQRELK